MVTEEMGAVTRTVLETLRTLLVWLLDLLIYYGSPLGQGAKLGEPWTSASWLQVRRHWGWGARGVNYNCTALAYTCGFKSGAGTHRLLRLEMQLLGVNRWEARHRLFSSTMQAGCSDAQLFRFLLSAGCWVCGACGRHSGLWHGG